MNVLKGELFLLELLQANNDMVGGGRLPRALLDEGCAYGFELGIVKDANGTALDIDSVAGLDQGLGGTRSKGRAVLKGLGLGPEVKDGAGHFCGFN